MSKWDKEYIKLCKKILKEGKQVENRTGIDTIKIPGYSFEFDLSKEFPALTTKQLFFRQAIVEMLWIYQVQSNDVRWLQERNVHIWDEWEIQEDGKWYATQMFYGWINNKFQNTQRLIETIKNYPTDRRMMMTMWQDDYIKTAVLPSCVWSSEWDVTDGRLNCWVHQRSCDVPLGLPFNVTQYATLLCLIAHCTGLKPGKMFWSIKDAHIYVNQIDGIKEQIERYETLPDLPAPELWINPEVRDFFKIDNSKDITDIKVLKYQHHGKISFPIAQ